MRTLSLLALGTLLLAGCSSDPGKKNEPVDVTGTVLLPNGQPAKNVTLVLFPTTAGQMQAYGELKADGKFSLKTTPGQYTFGFDGKEANLALLPKAYLSNDATHTIEIPAEGLSGHTIQLK